MTVGELIEVLKKTDPEKTVFLANDEECGKFRSDIHEILDSLNGNTVVLVYEC